MSNLVLVLGTVVFILWSYFLWSRRRFYKVYWQLRGPLGLPFIGLGLQMMKPEKFLQYMNKTAKHYKSPFISWMGTKCFLYVNDPETIETIFNSSHCTNKGDFYRFVASAIGDGLFTSSTPRWNKHRRLINPAFSRKVIHKFLPIFNQESNMLLNKLMLAQGQQLEIYEILKRSVLEAACQTTMGKKMNFQNDGSSAIFDSYNGITEVCVKRMLSPWLYPDVIYSCSPLFKSQQKYISVLYKFVENLLQQHDNKNSTATASSTTTTAAGATKTTPAIVTKEEMAAGKTMHHVTGYEHNPNEHYDDDNNANDENNDDDYNGGGISKSKSHVFVKQVRNHIDDGQLTWQDVRDEANVIVAATFETTSTALYLVCLCLAMHPEYQDKLYNELVEIFPANNKQSNPISGGGIAAGTTNNNMHIQGQQHCIKNNIDDNNIGIDNNKLIISDITLEHTLERMTYTEMVINEAMRLFAPVPMVLRSASSDFQLRNGTVIPQGTQIGIDIYNMQRSEQVWGPYADTFNPERHFGAASKPHPFAFIPFTKGLRMCIGYRYALMLMKIMLAKIFRNFRIQTDAKLNDLIIKGTISLKLCQYPMCTLQQRQQHQQQQADDEVAEN